MNYEFVQVSFAPNLTADGIMRKVKQFAKSEEHKDCDMSVVVISSHGDEGIIEVFFIVILRLTHILLAWQFPTCRQFHQHFTRAFFVRKFVQCQTLSKEKTFVPKMGEYNVDEIDNWSRFHQYFMRSFYVRRSQKRKKTVKPSVFFDFWDLLENYLSTEHLFYYLESEF